MDIEKKAYENLNEEKAESKRREKTTLIWDSYMECLISAINESKFMKRAESKPMTTPKAASESHVTSRSIHSREAADIAKRLADGLGLNGDYIYAGMLMHDAGHPFSAHEGEEIFNLIGQLENCGYFHHNAKGVEIIRSENILEKALEKIPEADRLNHEKQLRDEFDYFLDVIISHDGEATINELDLDEEKFEDIHQAVSEKLKRSNSKNNYKFVAQTPEGKLAKLADVIAYLASDIQDGFRLGIIKDFDDDYLEVFGEMFSRGYTSNRESKIAYAKDFIQKIKQEKIKELKQDTENTENKEILQQALDIIEEAKNAGVLVNSTEPQEIEKFKAILDKKIDIMRKSAGSLSEEEQQFLESDIQSLKEFVNKMTTVSSSVVQSVTTNMQEYFINNILANSQDLSKNAHLSEPAQKLFGKLKKLNYQKIVQYTKWDYQEQEQPESAMNLVRIGAQSLIKSGVIRDKFYSRSIRKTITETHGKGQEYVEHMRVAGGKENEYEEYRRNIGMRTFKNQPATINTKVMGKGKKAIRRCKYFRDLAEHTRKSESNFAIKYENVYEAIPSTVSNNLYFAVPELHERKKALEDEQVAKGKMREEDRTIKIKEKKTILSQFQEEKYAQVREKVLTRYSQLISESLEKCETIESVQAIENKIIADFVAEERKHMEERMATQMAIDYLAGMTDRSFNDLAIETGFLRRNIEKKGVRGSKASESVQAVLKEHERAEKLYEAKKQAGEGR